MTCHLISGGGRGKDGNYHMPPGLASLRSSQTTFRRKGHNDVSFNGWAEDVIEPSRCAVASTLLTFGTEVPPSCPECPLV